ncbi:Isochorismatase EC 3321 CDS [Bradyrhizobium sp.]|nr:Isochorismatase EC 3321 CDS [Bradyrhizobium sp.]
MISPLPALVVVDVQRAFDEWEAAGKRRNNPDAVARIADLLAAFRKRGAPIFHIRHEGTKPNSTFLPQNSGYTVKGEAREAPGEAVIVKRVNSAFIGTDLETRLRAGNITTLVTAAPSPIIASRRRRGWPAISVSTRASCAMRPGPSTGSDQMATSIRLKRFMR